MEFFLPITAILIHDKKEKVYSITLSKNIRKRRDEKILIDENLHSRYILKGKIIIFDELYRDGHNYSKKVLDIYKKLDISALAPLLLKNKLIGILALGRKESNTLMGEV